MIKKELIFLGPPASGKGTQTDMLAEELHLPHIDTGSLLRKEIKAGSKEGMLAKGFMDKGQLVPASLAAEIIIKELKSDASKNGFILDGFPRSIEQAKLLDKAFPEIDESTENVKRIVLNIKVDESLLLERIINRRSCPVCGKIYNLKTMPPKQEDMCDLCGATLIQRSDDTEEVAHLRFKTYFEQTAPLVDYYAQKGWLIDIDGSKSISEIYAEIKKVIS